MRHDLEHAGDLDSDSIRHSVFARAEGTSRLQVISAFLGTFFPIYNMLCYLPLDLPR